MGICFVGQKRKFEDFLCKYSLTSVQPDLDLRRIITAQYIPPKPGPIVDLVTKKKLGRHEGLWRYTIGQSARLSGQSVPMFVARKDPSRNTIFVVPGS